MKGIGAGRLKCDIFPKLYEMLTKFHDTSQFNVQARVVQKVDNQSYPPDKLLSNG